MPHIIISAGTGALTYRTVALPRGLVKAMHATLMILRQEDESLFLVLPKWEILKPMLWS
jgi:hypothetical protein